MAGDWNNDWNNDWSIAPPAAPPTTLPWWLWLRRRGPQPSHPTHGAI